MANYENKICIWLIWLTWSERNEKKKLKERKTKQNILERIDLIDWINEKKRMNEWLTDWLAVKRIIYLIIQ